MKGNLEDGCTGDGRVDVGVCGGPWLVEDAELSSSPAARWTATVAVLRTVNPRGELSPNWLWEPELAEGETVSLSGPMTVDFWATCNACGGIGADWQVRLFVDDQDENTGPHVEERLSAVPATPGVPDRLSVTLPIPPVEVSSRVVLQIEPIFVDVQVATAILYDSQESCGPEGPCDSVVRMPIGGGGGDGPSLAAPENLRVTDARDEGLRLSWEEVDAASSYEIHRSDTPGFTVSAETLLDETTEATYVDAGVNSGETRYYRVVASDGEATGVSLLAYGTVQEVLEQAKVKVDRLYAPVAWEYGEVDGSSWTFVWDRIGIVGEEHATPLVRVFSDGVASAPVVATEGEECPPLPGRGGPPEGRGPKHRCPGPPPGRGPGGRGPETPSGLVEDPGSVTETSPDAILELGGSL